MENIQKELNEREAIKDKQIASMAKEIDTLKKEKANEQKTALIDKLKAANVDVTDYDKKYSLAQIQAIADEFANSDNPKYATLKRKNETAEPAKDLDAGWFDHTPVPGFPKGVWRSSTNDEIIDRRWLEANKKGANT